MAENTNFTAPGAPWPLLASWFAEAEKSEPNDANAMSLATVGADGMPSVRIMLLKGYDENGFVFFTNRESRKGEQLKKHGKAALCFHWKSLRRQIRVEGLIEPVSDAESDAYFATRPRGSQVGAWASQQSRPLASRAELERRLHELEKQYEGKPVPRPPYWGGFRLVPSLIEVWQNGEFRLHDRFVYRRASAAEPWAVERQYP
jgi:pyridoxamine 5'-phosphate oxidase